MSEIYKNNIQVKTMQEHENPKILNGRKCVKLKEKKNNILQKMAVSHAKAHKILNIQTSTNFQCKYVKNNINAETALYTNSSKFIK